MKNKKNKKNYILVALLLLVVTITVGYAALSTTLKITGTSTITKQKWDVHFESLSVKTGSVTATTPANIAANTTEVGYNVTLVKPGDFYEFTVDVKNAGTLPAKVEAAPTISGVSTAQDVYTNYTVKWTDGTTDTPIAAGDQIPGGATKKVKVRIEYDTNIVASQLPTADQSMELTFSMKFVQGE